MFSKAKTKQGEDARLAGASESNASGNANSTVSKRSSSMKAAGVPSIISADVSMKGDIDSAGEVQLDGELEGDVRASKLIVGEMAAVRGEIIADHVTVRGKVEGGIRAKTVMLAASAQIMGDILHSSLSVESGAHFEGNCRHSDDPMSDASSRDFRKARPAPPSMPVKTTASKSAPGDSAKTDNAGRAGATSAPANSEAPSFLSPSRSPLR